MVTKRKQHSSQRAVKQGPAVTVSQPIKSGHPRLDNFRGRKPTPYGGSAGSREGVDLRAWLCAMHKILCTGRNVLETRYFGAGFCRRGFWAGGETGDGEAKRPVAELPPYDGRQAATNAAALAKRICA